MILSRSERERRYRLIKGMMEERNVSILIVASSAVLPGNVRYFSCFAPHSGYAYVVFPKEGEPTQFVRSKIQEQIASKAWIKDSRFASYNYGEALTKRIKELDYRGSMIGLVGADIIPFQIYQRLQNEFPSVAFVDVTKEISDLRMIKSEEEFSLSRQCARIADELFERMREVAEVGMSEFDVYAEMDYFLRKHHVEAAFNLIETGRFPIAPYLFPSEKVLGNDDSLLLELTPRYQGYYTQLTVVFPVKDPNPRMTKLLGIASAAQRAGLEFLKPGNRVGEVARAMKDVVEKAGFFMPYRGGHSLGLEHTEPPAVVPEDETTIRPGMTLVVHPSVVDKNGEGVFCGDSYLVTHNGWERLNTSFLNYLSALGV